MVKRAQETVNAAAAKDTPIDSELAADPLVAACRAGDPAAFEALYRVHAATIYRHLRALLDDADADDALQQTFAEAFKSLGRFEGRSKLSTWLHGIAVRVAANLRRSRKRRFFALQSYTNEQRGEPQTHTSLETSFASRQLLVMLDRHLERESEERRAAFIMHFVEEMPLVEVAAVLGRGYEAVFKDVKRMRARIAEAVQREVARSRRRDTEQA